ncbi:MAG: flagellar biosynthetic protein FliO [bacterium]|nr:flagellar biosynthetic protein FliO [bacterium]
MKTIVIFVLVLWLGCVGGMVADDTGKDAGAQKPAQDLQMPMSDSFSFIKSVMALSFVLGLIFLATYFFKKLTGVKTYGLGGFKRGGVTIHQVSSMPLGDKKFLSIVEIQGKHYFIGITQNSINLLSELQLEPPDPEIEEQAEGRDFASILHKAKELLNLNKVKK